MDNLAINGTADFTDEILAENGFSNAVNRATVVHNSNTGNSIIVPESGLEPPPLTTTESNNANYDAVQDALNELESAISDEQHNNHIRLTVIEEPIEESEDSLEEDTYDETDEGETDEVSELVNTATNIDAMDLAIEEAVEGTIDTNSNTVTNEVIIDSLPENPKYLLDIDETTSRFSGAAWYREVQNSTVIFAGMGGIGSWALLMLSRMKPLQVFIYDDDTVELANLSGQLYNKEMVGTKKVNAMAKLANDFSDYHGVMAIDTKWDSNKNPGDIMLCGFDNMEARHTFFRSWLKHIYKHPHPEKCLYIDARLAAEEFQVFCIQGNDKYNIERFSKHYMFTDREADATICSFKQTSYCANMIGSIIVNLYTNFIANTLNPIIPRDLPFKTYYDASMMFFKTEN